MSKKSFVPDKPIALPLPGELLVPYGDRLLWHQLGLQINGHRARMLTEDDHVALVLGFYPEGLESNVCEYRTFFNSRQTTMGLHNGVAQPVPVEFAE